MADQEYVYHKLDLDRPSIRLVKLLAENDSGIHCEILQTFLYEGVPYSALSYTWDSTEKTAKIRIGDANTMKVTENLFMAVQYLRPVCGYILLWVDAICIDQSNHKERGHQVQQMGEIYKEAESVIVWLGRKSEDSDLLLDSLKDWSQKATLSEGYALASPEVKARCCEALEKLLHRPWFKRVWILQEVAHAQRAFIHCGWRSISTRIFTHAPSLLGVIPDSHSAAVLEVMPGTLRRNNWYSNKPTLCSLLQKFHASAASDDRDRIYALLSMSSSSYERKTLKADYEIDLQLLIRDTTSVLLFPEPGNAPHLHYVQWTWLDFTSSLDNLPCAALTCALGERSPEVGVLLEAWRNDIDLNWVNAFGQTPLGIAAQWGDEDVMKLLLAMPSVEINMRDRSARTALWIAANEGHEGTVRLLLEAPGIKVNTENRYGKTALHAAFDGRHEGIVKLLLAMPGIDIFSKGIGRTLLRAAATSGDKDVVKMLLAFPGININAQDDEETPLYAAATRGHKDVVKMLLAFPGIEVNAQDNEETPLYTAAIRGHKDVVKMLLTFPGINTNSQVYRRASLWAAAEEGYKDVVKMLLAMPGIEVNTRRGFSKTPLYIAAKEGHKDVVKMLLAMPGIEVNAQDDKETPLHAAATRGHKDVVKMLLAFPGIEVNTQDNEETPLHAAAIRGHKDVVKMLLAMPGIEVNARRGFSETPLHIAAEGGHKDVVSMLLAMPGIKVDASNMHGETPLWIAVARGHEDIVQVILAIQGDKGVNVDGVEVDRDEAAI